MAFPETPFNTAYNIKPNDGFSSLISNKKEFFDEKFHR
nr:MAG TPA: hypothetical protein [Caudoviricetes sp.]